MAVKLKWFRLYSEIRDDPKMLEMDDHQRWLWICLMGLASEAPNRGIIEGYRLRGLAGMLRTTENKLREAIKLYEDLNMIEFDEEEQEIVLVNFMKRNYDWPSDTPEATRERKRKSRENAAKSRETADDVTTLSRECHDDLEIVTTDTLILNTTTLTDPTDLLPAKPKSKEKSTPKPNASKEHYALAAAIGDVCGIQIKIKGNEGKLFKCASDLKGGNPPATPEEVRLRYGGMEDKSSWWYKHTYVGRDLGGRPNLSTIRSTWAGWLLPEPQPRSNNGNGFSMGGSGARREGSGDATPEFKADWAEWERQRDAGTLAPAG